MPPNQPSETAMAATKKLNRFPPDVAAVIDSAYAPLVKEGVIIAVVLDEVISALVDQDAEFAQCPFARESLDAFKSALALATPKGDTDDA